MNMFIRTKQHKKKKKSTINIVLNIITIVRGLGHYTAGKKYRKESGKA